MTDLEICALRAISSVTMPVGSPHKRFRRDIEASVAVNPEFKLTERQALFLWRLVWRYRRQHRIESLSELALEPTLSGSLPIGLNLDGSHRVIDPETHKRPTTPKKKTRLEIELERGNGRLVL